MHPSIKSPCIAGVIKPSIYLPEDICTHVHPFQLEHVILHELAHYKRRDLICNLGAIIAAILHWFNPLVWLAVREMRYDREMASDACVMEILGERGVIPYGMTIINIAGLFTNRSRQFNLVGFNETRSQVERRVNMIKNYKKGSYKISVMAVLAIIFIGVVTLTTIGSVKPDVPTPVNKSIQGQLVLLDPAHGGKDPGATYPAYSANPQKQLQEKDLNMDIALKLKAMLEQSGLKVALSRQDDRDLSLDERIAWANQQDAALLVNIHNNSHLKSSQNGTTTYYKLIPEAGTKAPGNEANHPDTESALTGQRFAQIMQAQLVQQLGTADLGSQAMRIKILNEVTMPAVAPQIAFLSNKSDREKLNTEAFRIKAAQALHDGIIEALIEMQTVNNDNQEFQNQTR